MFKQKTVFFVILFLKNTKIYLAVLSSIKIMICMTFTVCLSERIYTGIIVK